MEMKAPRTSARKGPRTKNKAESRRTLSKYLDTLDTPKISRRLGIYAQGRLAEG